ncbi:MAG: hypothetical protein ACTSRU_12730 [Candidatus Hodarchaeales archaeon]
MAENEKKCDMKDKVLCDHYRHYKTYCKYGETHGYYCPYDHLLKGVS